MKRKNELFGELHEQEENGLFGNEHRGQYEPQNPPFGNVLLAAIKNGRFKEWFYEWKHGHPLLLNEEVDIICKTRDDPKFKHLNDREIQTLIQIRISDMYEKKYPDAKRWSLAHF